MRAHWVTAALLGAVLSGACGGSQPAQNTEETVPPETTATAEPAPPAAEPVSPPADTPPATPAKPAAKPSASARPATPAASAPARDVAPAPAAPAAPAARAPQYRTLRVPANTPLTLEVLTALSSETTTLESPVRARLKQAVSVDGFPILPAGTQLAGNVTEVEGAGRVKGRSRLAFAFTEVTMPGGAREKLKTNPIVFEGESTKGQDAAKIGVGAGVGAVIGGILGGGSGAAKGAAIGGGAGTGVVLATKGKEVTVAEGAEVAAPLSDPFDLRVRVDD